MKILLSLCLLMSTAQTALHASSAQSSGGSGGSHRMPRSGSGRSRVSSLDAPTTTPPVPVTPARSSSQIDDKDNEPGKNLLNRPRTKSQDEIQFLEQFSEKEMMDPDNFKKLTLILTSRAKEEHDSATIMSLGAICYATHGIATTVPYMRADAALEQEWQKKLAHDPSFKIGLCWQADMHNDSSRPPVARRGVPLQTLAPLQEVTGVTFYSLQKFDGADALNEAHTLTIKECGNDFDESHGRFMDTAALMKNLDLVITVDTAVAHLAGALGVPVWLMLPYATDWRWVAGRTDSPWYPTMRIFKQPRPFDWDTVVQHISAALTAHVAKRDHIAAIAPYAAQAREGFASPDAELAWGNGLLNLGNTFFCNHQLESAVAAYELLHTIFPTSAAVHHNLGSAYAELNRHHEAVTAFDTALKAQPHNADIHFSRALSLLAVGDYAQGWRQYEWRWERADKKAIKEILPWWDGTTSLAGTTIALRAEGSFGDVLQFARYIPLVKQRGAHVIVKTVPALLPLLKTVDAIDELTTTEAGLQTATAHSSLMSLPSVFTNSQETVPQPTTFTIPAELQEKWRAQLNTETFNIGLCWQADPYNDAQRPPSAWRSIPLSACIPLLNIPGTKFYSLQQVDGIEQLGSLPPGSSLTTFGADFDVTHGPFMDTAALIKNLDLVITVDTSVAHLAGSLGKPTILILPTKADWRWMVDTTTTPWYPTMQLVRRAECEPWSAVIERVVSAVHGFCCRTQQNGGGCKTAPIHRGIPQHIFSANQLREIGTVL